MIDTASILTQFRQAAEARGLQLPDHLDADGNLHRCELRDGPSRKMDGAYLLHLDGVPAGGFQNFKDGLEWENWRADIGRQLTAEEEAAHRARVEAQRAAREAEAKAKRDKARRKANAIWSSAKPAPDDHPYLLRKGVPAYGLRVGAWPKWVEARPGEWREERIPNALLVPMRSPSGMLARFGLLVWPETGGAWKNVDRYPDGPAKDAAFQVFEELDALDPLARGAEQEAPDGPPFLRFDPEALEAFTEWRTGFEADLRTGDLYPALESHLAKYRKLVPALALAFHLADGHHGPVGFAATLRALHWSVYLQTHARRCYGVAQSGEVDTGRRILERVRKGDLAWDGFGTRDIQRPGWSGLSNPKQVLEALELLVELGHLEAWQEPTRGRLKSLFVVNPKSLPVAAAPH